ncbi:MAG: adenosylmethionine---8-amino-7-oxononanoate aminotransferase [Frankiaceae bacterium]|nr:adenosylmethionine---8-amino-7-oxononanoate aminotransferase [Frankiaceae bacterium]
MTSPPSHLPSDPDDLRRLDARHVWHPYAPAPTVVPPRVVTGAAGVRLTLDDGRELVDGMSSWWAAIHGYRHPVLDQAVQEQLGRVAHVMFGGLTHEPATRLAARLVDITPVGLERVFLCDSGSVAVEVAAKMAMQFWQAQDRPRKSRLLTIRGGYHGDTFMAMSVCDPVNGMHHVFTDVLKEQVFAPMPPGGVDRAVDADWLAATSALFAAHADELAAVIIEPVVQGAGGMRFYDPSYVTVLRRLCDEHDVLLIADEIATGFGRAGALFAMELAGVDPDIMCVGKALTGGYLSLAATLCTARVAEVISSGAVGALLHGPTFMGNPLATAVAVASIDLLLDGDWQGNVQRIEKGLTEALTPARALPHVADVRVLGAIGVIELDAPVDVAAATDAAIARGVWLRPFGKLVYAMPPYVCSEDDVELIGAALVDAARVAVG